MRLCRTRRLLGFRRAWGAPACAWNHIIRSYLSRCKLPLAHCCACVQVSLVKDYVARQLTAESAEIAKDRSTIARLQAETATIKEEAQKLKTQPHVFQNSRCAATGQPLELPVVHFLCGHSFNLRSLGENDQECPLCAPDFKRVLDIRRNMKAGALKPDEFFMQLDASADGFSVIAEHFGRGLMNMTAQSMKREAAAASSNL